MKIHYDTPDIDGETIHIVITTEEAIKRQKEAALQYGCCYVNDKEALEDFIVIHWAWKEE